MMPEMKNTILTSSKGMAQLIFTLLVDKFNTIKTQRELAHNTELSLGVVNKYISQLETCGFIKDQTLVNYKRLLEYWVADFDRYIIGRIRIGRFSITSKDQSEDLRTKIILLKNGYWGGVKAADTLLNSELPSQFIVYTDKPNEIIKELRLRPDPEGSIEIRKNSGFSPG